MLYRIAVDSFRQALQLLGMEEEPVSPDLSKIEFKHELIRVRNHLL